MRAKTSAEAIASVLMKLKAVRSQLQWLTALVNNKLNYKIVQRKINPGKRTHWVSPLSTVSRSPFVRLLKNGTFNQFTNHSQRSKSLSIFWKMRLWNRPNLKNQSAKRKSPGIFFNPLRVWKGLARSLITVRLLAFIKIKYKNCQQFHVPKTLLLIIFCSKMLQKPTRMRNV